MTEPTQEQVAAERERAHEALRLRASLFYPWEGCCARSGIPRHIKDCTMVATALARRALEAEAKGRDDGIDEAMATLRPLGLPTDLMELRDIVAAIRALRSGTR